MVGSLLGSRLHSLRAVRLQRPVGGVRACSLYQVGGLPLTELNHLELQFLLLNDFRLAVPLEEMEAYGTMLVEFYAREVLAQQHTMLETHTNSSWDSVTTVTHNRAPARA